MSAIPINSQFVFKNNSSEIYDYLIGNDYIDLIEADRIRQNDTLNHFLRCQHYLGRLQPFLKELQISSEKLTCENIKKLEPEFDAGADEMSSSYGSEISQQSVAMIQKKAAADQLCNFKKVTFSLRQSFEEIAAVRQSMAFAMSYDGVSFGSSVQDYGDMKKYDNDMPLKTGLEARLAGGVSMLTSLVDHNLVEKASKNSPEVQVDLSCGVCGDVIYNKTITVDNTMYSFDFAYKFPEDSDEEIWILQWHFEGKEIQGYFESIERLVNSLIAQKSISKAILLKALGKLHFYLSHVYIAKRGSAWMYETLLIALAKYHGYNLSFKKGAFTDVKAICSSDAETFSKIFIDCVDFGGHEVHHRIREQCFSKLQRKEWRVIDNRGITDEKYDINEVAITNLIKSKWPLQDFAKKVHPFSDGFYKVRFSKMLPLLEKMEAEGLLQVSHLKDIFDHYFLKASFEEGQQYIALVVRFCQRSRYCSRAFFSEIFRDPGELTSRSAKAFLSHAGYVDSLNDASLKKILLDIAKVKPEDVYNDQFPCFLGLTAIKNRIKGSLHFALLNALIEPHMGSITALSEDEFDGFIDRLSAINDAYSLQITSGELLISRNSLSKAVEPLLNLYNQFSRVGDDRTSQSSYMSGRLLDIFDWFLFKIMNSSKANSHMVVAYIESLNKEQVSSDMKENCYVFFLSNKMRLTNLKCTTPVMDIMYQQADPEQEWGVEEHKSSV